MVLLFVSFQVQETAHKTVNKTFKLIKQEKTNYLTSVTLPFAISCVPSESSNLKK
jgi:hypothetical protein